jgi:integrase
MIYSLTRMYAAQIGIQLGPHDLRRTFARLAHDAGASVEDIQIVLGHVSITTTMRYIGVKQNLRHSPGDRIHMEIE